MESLYYAYEQYFYYEYYNFHCSYGCVTCLMTSSAKSGGEEDVIYVLICNLYLTILSME